MTYFWLTALILIADQGSKRAVEKRLPVEKHLPVYKHFELWHRRNKGVAFGHFAAHPKAVTAVGMGLCASLFTCGLKARSLGLSLAGRLGIACLLGGALGNLSDRLRKGYVTDFLHIKIRKWPIFNVADLAVLFGSLLILFAEGRKS